MQLDEGALHAHAQLRPEARSPDLCPGCLPGKHADLGPLSLTGSPTRSVGSGAAMPVAPEVGLALIADGAIRRLDEESARIHALVTDVRAVLDHLATRVLAADDDVVVDAGSVAAYWALLVRRSETEVRCFVPGRMAHLVSGLVLAADATLRPPGPAARAGGTRLILDDEAASMLAVSDPALERGSLGPVARRVTSLPLWMCLTDRSIALLPQGDRDDTAVLVRRPSIVVALGALFDSTWSIATGIPGWCHEDPADGSEVEPPTDERIRLLLRMLDSGAKDDAIARSLGVPVRAVGRMVAELCAQLGAVNRYQAGMLAVRRGWL